MTVRHPTDRVDGRTLRDLRVAVRDGMVVHRPVLVEVETNYRPGDSTARTMTVVKPISSVEAQGREYAHRQVRGLGPNVLHAEDDPLVTIGRSRRCAVRVVDDTVSKVHASIGFDPGVGEYFIVDEKSSNGTAVNGKAARPGERAALWSGAYLSFGRVIFAFLEPSTLRSLARLT